MIFIASYQKKKTGQKIQNTALNNQYGHKRRNSHSIQTSGSKPIRKKTEKNSRTVPVSSNQRIRPGNYKRSSSDAHPKVSKEIQKPGNYRRMNQNAEKRDSWMISPAQGEQTSHALHSSMKKRSASMGRPPQRKGRRIKLNPMTRFVLLVIGGIVFLVFFIESIAALWQSSTEKDAVKYSSTSSTITSPVSGEKTEETKSSYPEGTDPLTVGSITQLVNKTHGLPTDYEPSDLVKNDLPGMRDTYLRSEAAAALSELFAAAKSAGGSLICCSGYRSYQSQSEVYASEVANLGEYEAYMTTAPPGYSEHQTGLCIDVTSDSVNQTLTTDFINTIEGKWLDENAWRYGFIIRYPNGMEDITGYTYEPWHIRYLGKDVAKAVYESGKTYEEYLEILD